MDSNIPTAAEVMAALAPLSDAQLNELARISGVSYHTLLKIRNGTTKDPRIDTVEPFWPHVRAVAEAA